MSRRLQLKKLDRILDELEGRSDPTLCEHCGRDCKVPNPASPRGYDDCMNRYIILTHENQIEGRSWQLQAD